MRPSSGEGRASTRTFIVRFWFETSERPAGGGEWRGQVEAVPGGRSVYFRRVEGVLDALEELDVADDRGPDGVRPPG